MLETAAKVRALYPQSILRENVPAMRDLRTALPFLRGHRSIGGRGLRRKFFGQSRALASIGLQFNEREFFAHVSTEMEKACPGPICVKVAFISWQVGV
jgi:hypothetical protein